MYLFVVDLVEADLHFESRLENESTSLQTSVSLEYLFIG